MRATIYDRCHATMQGGCRALGRWRQLTGFDLIRAAYNVPDLDEHERAVLVLLAFMANDQGQAWPSIAYIVEKTGKGERTVQRAIQRLKAAGHLVRKQLRNGVIYTITPRIDALTPALQTPVAQTPVCETPVAQTATPAPQTPKQPRTTSPNDANASFAPKGARKARGTNIPDDWSAPPIGELEPEAQHIAAQWPAGAYAAEATSFRAYWQGEGRSGAKKHDWDKAWCHRICSLGAKPIREARAGLTFAAPGMVAANDADRPAAFELLAVGAERLGNRDEAARYRAIAADLRGKTGIMCERAPP